jgi:hypothetical protein
MATSRHGVAWRHCAGPGGTVCMVLLHQPSSVTWSLPWSTSSSPDFLWAPYRSWKPLLGLRSLGRLVELVATILNSRVLAFASLDGLQVRASIVDPIPRWVESYIHLLRLYLDDGHHTRSSPPCGVVLFVLHGAGMAFDRTKVTVVPSVLAGSMRHAHSCQSRHARLSLTSPCFSQGSGR